MLVRNPNLFSNIDMALKYFGFPYDKNVNFKLPKQISINTNKKFIIQSINGINHAIVDPKSDLALTSILYLLHCVNDELETNDYYIVPFEQLLNFFDNYDVLGLAFDRVGMAISMSKQYPNVLKEPSLITYKSNYTVNKDLSPMIYYGSLPLAYFTYHTIKLLSSNKYNTETDRHIAILIIYLLYDYTVSISTEINSVINIKNVPQNKRVDSKFLKYRNYLLLKLSQQQI